MSHIESPVIANVPRIGLRGDGFANVRPVSFSPAPHRTPGFSLRGTLLYPAVLTILSLAAHVVTRDKDGLR